MVLRPEFAPEVYLECKTLRQVALSRDHQGPRAVLNALERLANGYEEQCTSVQKELSLSEGQLRDYRSRLGTPFTHDAYLSELTSLRDQLKAALSRGTDESGPEPVLDASKIAAQIKALKSAHTIEATPERVSKRRASAEEPVTARIRRRAVDGPAVESNIESVNGRAQERSEIHDSSKQMPFRPERPGQENDGRIR